MLPTIELLPLDVSLDVIELPYKEPSLDNLYDLDILDYGAVHLNTTTFL
jgi:hypothetical protein